MEREGRREEEGEIWRERDRDTERERDFRRQMVYCILAIGPYTNPKTHKLNCAHRRTNKKYKQQNKQTK